MVDSRDGENDELWVNNKKVWSQKAQMAFAIQKDGSACLSPWKQGPADFPNPWGGKRAPACYVDRTVSVPCGGRVMKSKLTIRFHSGAEP